MKWQVRDDPYEEVEAIENDGLVELWHQQDKMSGTYDWLIAEFPNARPALEHVATTWPDARRIPDDE